MMLRTSNYASSTESIVHFGKINNAAIAELNRLVLGIVFQNTGGPRWRFSRRRGTGLRH
jgi:hypothetical protein